MTPQLDLRRIGDETKQFILEKKSLAAIIGGTFLFGIGYIIGIILIILRG